MMKEVDFMFTKRLLPLMLCLLLLIPLAACQKPETTGSSAPESTPSETYSKQEVLPEKLASPLPDAPWGTSLDDVKNRVEQAGETITINDWGNGTRVTMVPCSIYLPEDGFLGMPYADINFYTVDLRFHDDKLAEVWMYLEAESDQAIVDRLTEVYGEPTEVALEDWDFLATIAEFASDDTRLEITHVDRKPTPGKPIQYRLWFYTEIE